MNDITFRQLQALELKALLGQAADDPLLRQQLADRVEDAHAHLQRRDDPEALSDTKGSSRIVSGGDLPARRGSRKPDWYSACPCRRSVAQYEKMYVEQALHDERELARSSGRQRRQRGAATPELLFTGTPRVRLVLNSRRSRPMTALNRNFAKIADQRCKCPCGGCKRR